MSQDIHHFLREAGYLDSPAERLFWQGFTPTLRGHVRQLGLLVGFTSIPTLLLIGSVTDLTGSDALILALIFVLLQAVGLVAWDLLAGFVLRIHGVQQFLGRRHVMTLCQSLLFLALCVGLLRWLHEPLVQSQAPVQVLYGLGIMAVGFSLAFAARHLVIARLYWHGAKPPSLQRHRWLTVIVIGVALVFHFLEAGSGVDLPAPNPPERPERVVLLCFDIPQEAQPLYLLGGEDWQETVYDLPKQQITQFWAGLGTGSLWHGSSLWQFKTPLFLAKLDRQDPTQSPVVQLLQLSNLAEPLAGGRRYRKYLWEILDQAGIPTAAYGYWHSFPAMSQHGSVLTERWNLQDRDQPFQKGVQLIQPEKSHRLESDELRHLRPFLQRENQTWGQLQNASPSATPPFSVAYFPLSDHFERLEPSASREEHLRLAAFRSEQLTLLLNSLGPDTLVGIIIANGKAAPATSARLRVNAAWQRRIPRLEQPLQLCATFLNYFGLPADYLMEPSASKDPSSSAVGRVDYGEPQRLNTRSDQQDATYYQELKNLGYIR